jgi:hypothetical protein
VALTEVEALSHKGLAILALFCCELATNEEGARGLKIGDYTNSARPGFVFRLIQAFLLILRLLSGPP